MAGKSAYLVNKLVDWFRRAQAFTPPTNVYLGLLCSTRGPRANSTTYAVNDTFSLTAGDGKTHLYKVTAQTGNSAAAQPAGYAGVEGETVTDGGVTAVEQGAQLDQAIGVSEPNWGTGGTAYVRPGVASALAGWAGTQGAGTTTASSGTGSSGTTSNNAQINFNSGGTNTTVPSGGGAGPWYVWGDAEFDAASGGNALYWGPLPAGQTKTINVGDPVPYIAAGSYQVTES
jgi:hypothetical protein